VWAIGTSVGLVALLLASEPVFQALKLLGAAYLIFLGIQLLRSACARSPRPRSVPAAGGRTRSSGLRVFRQGLINDLANPKMAVFFASVLPQFAPEGHGMLSALVALGLVFAALTFLWLALYAAVVARAGAFVRGSRVWGGRSRSHRAGHQGRRGRALGARPESFRYCWRSTLV
jgi:threonine/homoserine/homoserine lactone efflux protein